MYGLILIAFAFAQPQAPLPPQAPPVREERLVERFPAWSDPVAAQRKPTAVFVGTSARAVLGLIVCEQATFPSVSGPRVIVALPYTDGTMRQHATLSATATDSEIRIAAGLEQPAANPFDRSLSIPIDRPAKTALPDSRDAGKPPVGWPKSIEWADGMRVYPRTKFVQRVAVTNGAPSLSWYGLDQDDVWANAPPSINPNRLAPWRTPGGLDGVHGWESTLAVYLPSSPAVRLEPTPIANGGLIPAYRWTYPDGTVFADLLTHGGRPFELRMREKTDGRWDSFVAWRNRDARPAGYVGAGKRCAECHDRAGASEQYGIMLRGADTVFSYLPLE
jgi:hypothetical protein